MVHRPTRSAGLFLLAQISIIAGMGYGLSHFEIGMQTLLWLIFISVVWIGLVAVYVLVSAVDRVVERLNAISKQINMTPQEKEARP
jgi:type III secretory pathway component EscU